MTPDTKQNEKGRLYILNLKQDEEVVLHALEILQTDLVSCFIPVYMRNVSVSQQLLYDVNQRTAFSKLNKSQKQYIKKHWKRLFSRFWEDLCISLDYAMCPAAILFDVEHIFFDAEKDSIMCWYTPLRSVMDQQVCLLSAFSTDAIDTLLGDSFIDEFYPEEEKENLLAFFRQNDEKGLIRYLHSDFWSVKRDKLHAEDLQFIMWAISFPFFFIALSVLQNQASARIISTKLLSLIFILINLLSVSYMLVSAKRKKRKKQEIQKRVLVNRKERETRLLFPEEWRANGNTPNLMMGFHPIQFIELPQPQSHEKPMRRFVIWTDRFLVGSDSDLCDYCIADASLAYRHALFVRDEKGMNIEAISAEKNTYVNRRKVTKRNAVPIEDGDIIGLGDLEFEAHYY